jgi:hypothetical protein
LKHPSSNSSGVDFGSIRADEEYADEIANGQRAPNERRGREAGAAVIEACRSVALAYLFDRKWTLP